LEISVAVHSIIIGIALGSAAGAEELPSMEAYLIAICFHQFFEGMALGE
jgi:zinc transporter 1/2/3